MSNLPIKFIIDIGVGRSIEQWLISANFNVLSVASINAEIEDDSILKLANAEDAIYLLQWIKDFGELIFSCDSNYNSISNS